MFSVGMQSRYGNVNLFELAATASTFLPNLYLFPSDVSNHTAVKNKIEKCFVLYQIGLEEFHVRTLVMFIPPLNTSEIQSLPANFSSKRLFTVERMYVPTKKDKRADAWLLKVYGTQACSPQLKIGIWIFRPPRKRRIDIARPTSRWGEL